MAVKPAGAMCARMAGGTKGTIWKKPGKNSMGIAWDVCHMSE